VGDAPHFAPAAARESVQRKELKSLRTESRSLVPEGLEAAMDPTKLRDLIEFLQNGIEPMAG
jgi:hypothetical protein